MDMICKGLSDSECFQNAIAEYEMQLMDKRAESQTKTQPLRQALKIFKFVHGYGQKQTFQSNKEAVQVWEAIKKEVMRHYLVWDMRDIRAEDLAEANLYAIELIKDTV